MFDFLKRLFKGGKPAPKQKGYSEVLALGGANTDWALNFLSEDADLWRNHAVLRDRSRDLFKTNPYFRKYKEELFANVFGDDGIRLRMKVKEEADRVVYAADAKGAEKEHQEREKAILDAHAERMERIRKYTNWKLRLRNRNGDISPLESHGFLRSGYDRGKATVQAGAVDLYACRVIEEAWREWQRKEYCTMTGKLTYNDVRNLRLLAAARDGEIFIRKIDFAPNKYKFSLQIINSEWCDFNLNVPKLPNGNSIRMGVELDAWGKPVAYHFIKQDPWTWQYGQPGWSTAVPTKEHERIEAKEIIHYARFEFGDSTRGAPWTAAVILNSRQLGKFEEAEVVAARLGACKMGTFESDIDPEGGAGVTTDPCKNPGTMDAIPGSIIGLPNGVSLKALQWSHPSQNFDDFRKGMLRSWCAGLPGADYNVIANDLEGISFSAGRLGRLGSTELWKLLQRFDIDAAERPIFEAWLEMALMSGAIPLPYAKIEKYNKPHFTGRRWQGVDVLKEINAAVVAITNKLMSYSQWFDDQGEDLEEVWMQIAEEQMIAEELGIDLPKGDNAPEEETDDNGKKKPKAKSWEEDEERERKQQEEDDENDNGAGKSAKKKTPNDGGSQSASVAEPAEATPLAH